MYCLECLCTVYCQPPAKPAFSVWTKTSSMLSCKWTSKIEINKCEFGQIYHVQNMFLWHKNAPSLEVKLPYKPSCPSVGRLVVRMVGGFCWSVIILSSTSLAPIGVLDVSLYWLSILCIIFNSVLKKHNWYQWK